jgi:hypothetical protein
MKRRELIRLLAAIGSEQVIPLRRISLRALAGFSLTGTSNAFSEYIPHFTGKISEGAFPGVPANYHGYNMYNLTVDGCRALIVQPKEPLPGRPWVWRTMFWDAFPEADLAFESGIICRIYGCRKHFRLPRCDEAFRRILQRYD